MSFDVNHHLAAKTIGLAPLVKLLANVQKTGPGEATVPPPRETMLIKETVRSHDYLGYFSIYDTGHTTLATPTWPIMSGGTETRSTDLVFGAGMKIVTLGVYIQQQFGSGTGDRASFDALNESMTFAAWLKLPTTSAAARVISLQGSYYVAVQEGNQMRFRFFGTPSPNIFITYTPGVWAYWAFTYDGTNLKIYKDGELI